MERNDDSSTGAVFLDLKTIANSPAREVNENS